MIDENSEERPVVGDYYVTCEHPAPDGLNWFRLMDGVLKVRAVSVDTSESYNIHVKWMSLCSECAKTPLEAPRLATKLCVLEEALREKLPN